MPNDKQLRGIRLEDVLEKRRLDQALEEGLEETFPGSDPVRSAATARCACSPSRNGVHWQ